jgi:hypothetical protein
VPYAQHPEVEVEPNKMFQPIPSVSLREISHDTHSDVLKNSVPDFLPKNPQLTGSLNQIFLLHPEQYSGTHPAQFFYNAVEAFRNEENSNQGSSYYNGEISSLINVACGREKQLDNSVAKRKEQIAKLERQVRFRGSTIEQYLN